MKTKLASLVISLCIFLTACTGGNADFRTAFFGELSATENALVCLGDGKMALYSPDGEELAAADIGQNAECLTEGKYALIHTEQDIYLTDGKNIQHNHIDNIIMSTDLNENGLSVICTDPVGYAGSATVFDKSLHAVYRWSSADAPIIKAALSEKNTLAVLTRDENESRVHIFSLDGETEKDGFVLSDAPFDIAWMGDRLCLGSETAIRFASEGRVKQTVRLDRPLGAYVVSDGFAVFELINGDYTSELISLDAQGNELGSIECVLPRCLTAKNSSLALLTDGEAVVYTKDLCELKRIPAVGIRNIMLTKNQLILVRDSQIMSFEF